MKNTAHSSSNSSSHPTRFFRKNLVAGSALLLALTLGLSSCAKTEETTTPVSPPVSAKTSPASTPQTSASSSSTPSTDTDSDTSTIDTSTTSPEVTEAPQTLAPGAAQVRWSGSLTVYDAPDGSSIRSFDDHNELGSQAVMLVLAANGDWLQVSLPVRPNGSTGWVRLADVEVSANTQEIQVDTSSHTLSFFQDGQLVFETPAAVGASATPTPLGVFYVTDILDTQDPHGAYGPFALGLSARSNVLESFGGGDGQVGIHGTNDSSSIGNPVSHGCIRLPNDLIVQLSSQVRLGTPVTIV